MTTEQLANSPFVLPIEGINANGEPLTLNLKLARSLPTAVSLALNDDLVALGKRSLNGYVRVQAQLDWLWDEAKKATVAKNREAAERYTAAWNRLVDRLHDTTQSGEVEDLNRVQYWLAGRKSIDGLCRELSARIEAASGKVNEGELRAVITDGNCNLVLMRLQQALGELEDPTAGT